MPKNWTVTQTDECVLFAFREHTRWDVSAAASFPALASRRLALQIRQDMWRALQGQRGFSPVVRLQPATDGWSVQAGGQLSGPTAAAEAKIAQMFDNAALRARWTRFAQKGMLT